MRIYRITINGTTADIVHSCLGEKKREGGDTFQVPCGDGDIMDKLKVTTRGIMDDAYGVGDMLTESQISRVAADVGMKELSDGTYIITTQTFQQVLGQEAIDRISHANDQNKRKKALDKALREYEEKKREDREKDCHGECTCGGSTTDKCIEGPEPEKAEGGQHQSGDNEGRQDSPNISL